MQALIVDEKAVALEQLQNIMAAMATFAQTVERPPRDLNRKQMRAFEARMRPFRLKLARLRVQQAEIQKKIDAILLAENNG
jgi:hypothetical protein